MKKMSHWIRTFTVMTLAAAMTLTAYGNDQHENKDDQQPAAQQDQKGDLAEGEQEQPEKPSLPDKQAKEDQGEASQQEQQKDTRQLAVFELKHRDANQMREIIALRFEALGIPSAARLAFPGRRTTAYRGAVNDQGLKIAIAGEGDNQVLFVRGNEDEIAEIKGVVSALDVEADQLKSYEFGECRLIPIHGDHVSQVRSTLQQLGLEGKFVSTGDVTLVALGTDDNSKQAEKVIEKCASMAAKQQQTKESNDQGEASDQAKPEDPSEAQPQDTEKPSDSQEGDEN